MYFRGIEHHASTPLKKMLCSVSKTGWTPFESDISETDAASPHKATSQKSSPEKRTLFSDDDEGQDASKKIKKFSKKNFVKKTVQSKKKPKSDATEKAKERNVSYRYDRSFFLYTFFSATNNCMKMTKY